MAEILCGLLCRFMGSRFVASSGSAVVCSTGSTHMNSSVQYIIRFTNNIVHLTIRQTNASETSTVVSTYKTHIGSETASKNHASIVRTVKVAKWVSSKTIDINPLRTPYPGIKGCKRMSSLTISAAVLAYVCERIEEVDGPKKTVSGNSTMIEFWDRYIVIKTPKERMAAVPIPCTIRLVSTQLGYVFLDNSPRQSNDLDALVVKTCQEAMIIKG